MGKRIVERKRDLMQTLKEDQEVRAEYHSPAGERFEITGIAFYSGRKDALLIQSRDERGNYCEVTVTTQAVNAVFRVVTVEDKKPSRNPIGFHGATGDS